MKDNLKPNIMKNLIESFQNLINGNQFTAGTKHEERFQIWNQFVEEFSSMVCIEIEGMNIHLDANTSTSGKSTSYFGSITKEQYFILTGSTFGYSKKNGAFISIQNGVIEICGGGKYFVKYPNNKVSNLLPF